MDPQAQIAAATVAPYHRIFVREVGGYSASILELPGVFGGGDTVEEANQTLEEALADWVAIELEAGHDIPAPVDQEAYSGRLQLRIPPSLHYAASMRAEIEGVSLNRLLSDAVAQLIAGTPAVAIVSGDAAPLASPGRRSR